MRIDLTEVQNQTTAPVSKFQPHEHHLVNEIISKLVEKGVIRKVPLDKGQYVSKIFLRPKADWSQRLILNLKKFNESVVFTHFKMDSIQKILKLVLATLHKMGHISTVYIDDCYLQGSTYNQCIENMIDSVIFFDSLGFVAHPTKSTLVPSQEIVILGFIINSAKMTIRLTRDKAIDLKRNCE